VRRTTSESRTPDGKQFEILDDAGEKFSLVYRPSTDGWVILPLG
jgi:hypothetical protein